MRLHTSTAEPARAYHRRSRRQGHIIEASLYAAGAHRPASRLDVVSMDLSRQGIGLALAAAVNVGDVYHLEMGDGGQCVSSSIRIIRCQKLDDGFYRVGAEFC